MQSSDSELTAVSPIDGRYRQKTEKLASWFSESGLMRLRLQIEIEYVIALLPVIGKKDVLNDETVKKLRNLYTSFTLEDAKWIKTKENEIKHDVKSIEYFIQEKVKDSDPSLIQLIHFGLTSEDVNVPAYASALSEGNKVVITPALNELVKEMKQFVSKSKGMVMLARTHGQPAVPTTMGKEMKNFLVRIEKFLSSISGYTFDAKMTGAVGNYNALVAAYPDIDWIKFTDTFISSLGLHPNHYTTQILPYDVWLEYFSKLKLLNNVLIGFCQDMWRYISDEYIVQIPKEGEVGSSTMPQKINPIDFENAEGNLAIANALFELYERKLSISRLQRDLSDSTVKRTFGMSLAHSLLAYQNIVAGLKKVAPNKEKMSDELRSHWEVVAEGIQTTLRAEGIPDAYEKLKNLTRGKKITEEIMHKFIDQLDVSPQTKKKLSSLSPETYLGISEKLT